MADWTQTLDEPDVLHATSSVTDGNVTTASQSSAGDPAPSPPVTRYVLGAEIARGGMGEVYRAADTVLHREVAVKVLQDKYPPTSAAARRFDDEARITGQLQHPNIPAVHDLGTLPDGRPFLAMKLIQGETLDDLLMARPDPAMERGKYVAVFEAICQGVAYAHAHGVIHRDLKPANVMVGAFGEVQVMDWGLAKVLRAGSGREGAASGTESTPAATAIRPTRDATDLLTQAGSVLGTPAYMPPEQASGAVHRIDRRSDVFGLGGILSAILTGTPPFVGLTGENTRQLAAAGKVQDCFARLDASGADPELVALAKRCLAPQPDDRPADAAAVAAAVRDLRAAADERARQAEVERERVTVREAEGRKRRRVWLGLAASLAGGLVAAVGLAVWADVSRRSARLAERTADERRMEAESETLLANAVKDFLKKDVLQLADPATQQADGTLAYDAEVKLRDVVMRASTAIDGKFADRPLVEAELRWTLGYTLTGMGRGDLAVPHYERVRAIYTRLKGPDHPDTLSSLQNLANSYDALGRPADALTLREETLARRTRTLGPDHPATLQSMIGLSTSCAALGRQADALRLREETLARLTRTRGPDHPDTLTSTCDLALSYAALGRQADALRLREETLARRTRTLGPDHPATLQSMSRLALSYVALGRQPEALDLRARTLALQKAKLGPDHPDTLLSMSQLASTYAALGRLPEALNFGEETLARRTRKLGPDHPDTLFAAWGVIATLLQLKRPDEALPRIDEVLALADQATAIGKRLDPRLKTQLLIFRAQIFAARKDALGCRESAERYEKVGRTDGFALYDAACLRGVLAGLLKDRPEQATAEADQAMVWLRQAVAAGWRNRAHLDTDTDLDALRGRADFKELVGSLPDLVPPPRLVK